LDLGAHAPFYLSNTALFYINGSRGVNVEPNPELIDQLKRERPLDKNINLGVSRAGGSSEFFCMEDPALSTFSKHECDRLVAFGKKLKQVATVRTLPLVRIVNEYCEGVFPDFLSIDIEGMELEILSSIRDMATYPKVICVETAEYSPIGSGEKRKELMRLIESLGFQLYADTNLNSIYVRKEFWTQVAAKPA
jgi:FkbM family methyltransferase